MLSGPAGIENEAAGTALDMGEDFGGTKDPARARPVARCAADMRSA